MRGLTLVFFPQQACDQRVPDDNSFAENLFQRKNHSISRLRIICLSRGIRRKSFQLLTGWVREGNEGVVFSSTGAGREAGAHLDAAEWVRKSIIIFRGDGS
jgi:hypothetical protein